MGILILMNKTPLTLHHGRQIAERLDSIGMHLSEFSFPNLYLFRGTHHYEFIETDNGHIFISGLTYDKKRYLMPMTRPSKLGEECFGDLKKLLSGGGWDFIFPIPEEWLDCFDEKDFERSFNPNDSDYLFFTEKFKTYPGKKMHKKKNLLNQFLRSYDSEIDPLGDTDLDAAESLLELWQETSPQELSASDYTQCREALEMRSELNLTGAIIRADDKPAAFFLGEPLNEDTFTIHFAKADISYKGVYQFLFSRIASDFCPDYRYMNLEQDMGSEGLRKTKVSYRPDLMARKYRIAMKR